MVLGSADKTVKFWDLETFELIGSGGTEVSCVVCTASIYALSRIISIRSLIQLSNIFIS
jgi:WD40 repeat protein